MKYQDLKKLNLPDTPGVYFFVGRKNWGGKPILYIGRATSLKDRVKSYFSDDILRTRGLHIANMVTLAKTVRFIKTDSVLEALLLENQLIKKWKPKYNTKEKDDKSFNYVAITDESFPRVLIMRGKDLHKNLLTANCQLLTKYGPFPHGALLRDAMKIIRRIFPYRDVCKPASQGPTLEIQKGQTFMKPCFNRQLGLCPGVCTGEISEKEYREIIRGLKLFFDGKKKEIIMLLKKEMNDYAKEMKFEKANAIKKRIFCLKHIKDISLVKDNREEILTDKVFRIEAYDIAHLSGTSRVGAMAVLQNDEPVKSEYRKFKLEKNIIDDTKGLAEILKRRLKHIEWTFPDLIVVDGGLPQKNITGKIIKSFGLFIPVVAVVKDERHKPKKILGDRQSVDNRERAILIANSEAHRFSLSYHRNLRSGLIKMRKIKTS